MNCSTPGLPVHHQLLEFTQTQVHWVGDAIQPSHPLSSPYPPALNPSKHKSLFQWVNQLFTRGGQSTGVSALASFLPKNTQGWSPLEKTGWISSVLGELRNGWWSTCISVPWEHEVNDETSGWWNFIDIENCYNVVADKTYNTQNTFAMMLIM